MADTKAKTKKAKKPNAFVRIGRYLRACWGEIKKITWTSPKATTKSFLVVLAVIVVSGLCISGLDQLLFFLLSFVGITSGS